MKTEQKWFITNSETTLPEIPKNSIDLLITDPPYLVNHTTGSKTSSMFTEKWMGSIKCSDKTMGMTNIIKFKDWLPLVFDVLKNPSHAYIFTNDKNLQELLNASIDAGFRLHNVLVWKKNNVTPNLYYMKNCEFVVFLHKGNSFRINKLESSQFLDFDNINGKDKLHPTQKPVSLLEFLILNSSKEGETIIDPFLGSGSILEACRNTNRNCIGFEIDPQWEPIYRKRLKSDNAKLDAYI